MTLRANSRLAGATLLLYIAMGIGSMILFRQATGGAEGAEATLASIAEHQTLVRLTAVLSLLMFVNATALAVALYALTREQDRDLAALALCCRFVESVIAAVSAVRRLELLSLATGAGVAGGPEAAAVNALGALLLKTGGAWTLVAATCFAAGSTIFSYLFLRARSIPVTLAWLGVFASVLLLAALPAQMAGFLGGPATWYVWMPMLVFEVVLALWLIIRGVATPQAAAGRGLP